MSIRTMRTTGHFNFADPSQESAQWIIWLPEDAPARTISQTVEIDGEFDSEYEDDPWEIADLIEGHIDKLWFSSSRSGKKEAIQWMRENENRLRIEWLNEKILKALTKIEGLQDSIKQYHNQIQDILDE